MKKLNLIVLIAFVALVMTACDQPSNSAPPAQPPEPETVYYTLSFDTNGGNEMASVQIAENTVVDLTAYTATKSGNEFYGWDTDSGFTMTADTTVKANWTLIQYKVRFILSSYERYLNDFTDVSNAVDISYEDNGYTRNGKCITVEGTVDNHVIDVPAITNSNSCYPFIGWHLEGKDTSINTDNITAIDINTASYTFKSYTINLEDADENNCINFYGVYADRNNEGVYENWYGHYTLTSTVNY